MLRTLLLLAMAYGVRRNEANGDCPGFKGDGVCEWGATRKSDGHGREPRPTCYNCSLKKSPPEQPNKRKRADGDQQTQTAPRASRPAATDAFTALDGRGISPVPIAPGRPPNDTQWDGEQRTHTDPNSHAAWAFNNRRDGGSRHYQMFDSLWSTESHGWIQSQKMSGQVRSGLILGRSLGP